MGKPEDIEIAAAAKAAAAQSAVIAEARLVGPSVSKAGDKDLRDAEMFRALREKENE